MKVYTISYSASYVDWLAAERKYLLLAAKNRDIANRKAATILRHHIYRHNDDWCWDDGFTTEM